MGVNTTAVLWITLAALALLIGTIWLVFGPRLRRRARAAQVRPAIAPNAATPGPGQPRPAPAAQEPRLIPELNTQLAAAAEGLEPTYAAIAGIPERLRERVSMRAEAMAAEQALVEIRARAAAGPAAQPSLAVEAQRVGDRLKRICASAERVADDEAQLAALGQRLRAEAHSLATELDELATHQRLPLSWGASLSVGAAAVRVAQQLPVQSLAISHDQVKRELGRTRGLLGDIGHAAQQASRLRAQRESLLQLLDRPELAEQPEWHRVLQRASQRARALGEPASPLPEPALAQLLADADDLLHRRQALFVGCPPAAGGFQVGEERLPVILAEAEAIQRELRELLGRARALAARRSVPA